MKWQNDATALYWYQNQKVRLCIDPASLNQVLIRPVHSHQHSMIFLKSNNEQNLSVIDASLGYHLTRDHLTPLHLHANLVDLDTRDYHLEQPQQEGNMFQRKIDEIFKYLPNVFGIADDILAVGYHSDGEGHNDILLKEFYQYADR